MIQRRYDAAALHALLPHRFPLLLVDRIDVIEPGRRVVGFKRLTTGEWWSPGNTAAPMPFTLVLEALAQTIGALIPDLADAATRVVPYFVGADRVRMRRAPRAGDELQLDVSLVKWRRGLCRARGIASIDGDTVLTAQLTAMLRGTE